MVPHLVLADEVRTNLAEPRTRSPVTKESPVNEIRCDSSSEIQTSDGSGNRPTPGSRVGFGSRRCLRSGGMLTDGNGSVDQGAIEAIAAAGITFGCNPPRNDRFCPDDSVTRGQMAAFIARAGNLPSTNHDYFDDNDRSTFEDAINRMAEAGITRGCNPPANDRFCATRTITRGEMAAFLARAFDEPHSSTDHFVDDNRSIFEDAINRIADAGITLGCDPPTNSMFCPGAKVTRGQMAAFLMRALGLTPLKPPPPAGGGSEGGDPAGLGDGYSFIIEIAIPAATGGERHICSHCLTPRVSAGVPATGSPMDASTDF